MREHDAEDAKGDVTAQTANVLDQIEESLKLAGSSMDRVLKVNVYLTDMKNFEDAARQACAPALSL